MLACPDQPTSCTTRWGSEPATLSALFVQPGLQSLTASPLRYFQVDDWAGVAPLLNDEVIHFLGQLLPLLRHAFPLQSVALRPTPDRELLVLALLGDELTPKQAVDALDGVLDWFVQHSPADYLVLDTRRV